MLSGRETNLNSKAFLVVRLCLESFSAFCFFCALIKVLGVHFFG
jgi:hypothetical protein